MRCLFGAFWTDMAVDPGEAAGVDSPVMKPHFFRGNMLIHQWIANFQTHVRTFWVPA
jgi:hypothetical protein